MMSNMLKDLKRALNVRAAGIFGEMARKYAVLVPLILILVILFSVIFHLSDARKSPEKSESAQISSLLTKDETEWLRNHKTIRVLMNSGWAPIEFITEGKRFKGVTYDYFDLLGKQLGVRFVPIGFDDRESGYEIYTTTSGSKVKDGFKLLPEPYLVIPITIYTRNDDEKITGLADLMGKKVAIFKNGQVGKLLAQNEPTIDLYNADIAEEALAALADGQVDAYIGNELVISYVAAVQGYSKVKKIGDTPYSASISMAVRSDLPLLSSILKKALNTISLEEKKKIYQRWHSPEPELDPKIIYALIGSIVFLGGIVFVLRKKLDAEIELRVREVKSLSQKFHTLFEFTPDPVLIIDGSGKILLASKKCEPFFGVENLIGKSVGNFLPEKTRLKYLNTLGNLFQQLSPETSTISRQLTILNGKGQKIPVEVSIASLISEDEKWLALSCRDISSHKYHQQRLTDALSDSYQRYHLIAAATIDGIWDWDLETNNVYQSPRYKEQLGYEDHEIESSFSTWADRIHPDDFKKAMENLLDCVAGKTPFYENLHRLRHRDSSWHWFLDRGITLRDENNKAYRMAGSHSDVTILKSAQEALESRERELDAIFHISPDGIITVTRDGKISSVNPAFCQMTGLYSHDLIGSTELRLNQKLSELSEDFGKDFKDIDLDTYTCHYDENSAFTFRLNNPNSRYLQRAIRHLTDQQIAKIMYFRDVSKETEVDQMKSEFLSAAAHELRTPMSSIYGFTELLLARDFEKDKIREILQIMHEQSAELVHMINELLDLARIEARGGRDFNFEPTLVSDIINGAVQALVVPGDDRTVSLPDPKSEGMSCTVFGDIQKLKQALMNVLSNAFKYSPSGGKIEIDVLISRDNSEINRVGIRVSDQGIGMTTDQISHVFERFWRANSNGKIRGTGLGMPLVREIIDIHHGSVEISSEYGKGTKVTLWLGKIQTKEIIYASS